MLNHNQPVFALIP